MNYSGRRARAVAAMNAAGIDAMCVSLGSDLPYLTGFRAHESERLTMLVLDAERTATLVIPALEAPMVPDDMTGVDVVAWTETESPIDIVDSRLGAAERVAVGSQTWSRFTLALQDRFERSWFDAEDLMRDVRICKDPDEIEALRSSATVVDGVVPMIAELTFTGRTEVAMRREITELSLVQGLDTVEFCIVASGPNGASPHHVATERVITDGDAIVIDFGGRKADYCSDTTRNFVVGEPPAGYADAHVVLYEAHRAATAAVKPGIKASELDRIARTIIEHAGYGDRFIHRLGHGIGLDVHEPPFLVEGDDTVLQAGMAFSIEPGIYTPGEWGMRIEDIVVVTETGVDVLNTTDRRFHTVR